MRLLYVFSMLCMLLGTQLAFARSPAVLDFVGIEHESFKYQRTPSGDQTSFNFEKKDYSSYQKNQFTQDPVNTFSFSTFAALLFILCLPFTAWLIMKVRMDKKSTRVDGVAGVEIIAKYREAKKLAEESKDYDDIKKAS
jgi:hypothetical protein